MPLTRPGLRKTGAQKGAQYRRAHLIYQLLLVARDPRAKTTLFASEPEAVVQSGLPKKRRLAPFSADQFSLI
jgi:hypothetical protein